MRFSSLSNGLLKAQAENFAAKLVYTDFKCNNGWLHHFKNRQHCLCLVFRGKISVLYLETANDRAQNV